MPNPVPRPASQSRQPNRGVRPRRVVVTTPRSKPPRPPKDLTGPGLDWFRSLISSRQSAVYEDSDWHTALAAGYCLTEAFNRDRPPSHRERHHREWRQIADALLCTEKSRRAVHFEPEGDGVRPAAPPASEYRARVGGGRGASM